MILVTGATGTIGHPLVDLLVGGGADVRAVSRNASAAGLPAGVQMIARGFPEPFVAALMARYATYLRQPQHLPTGDVDKALGCPGRTFAEWVADHTAAFRKSTTRP